METIDIKGHTWYISRKLYLKHLQSYQLRLFRIINEPSSVGTVFGEAEFASVLEGNEKSFMLHGRRSDNIPEIK